MSAAQTDAPESSSRPTVTRHSVAVIGGGSAAEALTRALGDSDHDVVVFEPEFVGGECPFLACMPSKSMLHDRTTGRDWEAATARRDEIVSHLDDADHADDLDDLGVTLVRSTARIVAAGVVEDADGVRYEVDHVVIATGATPNMPDIDGLDPDHDRVWTSRDALTRSKQPESVVVIGGGVIGSELAFMFAGFGTKATTLDSSQRVIDDFHPQTSSVMTDVLTEAGVEVVNGVDVVGVTLTDDDVTVTLDDGATYTAERVLVAVGRSPALGSVGLASLGVDPDEIELDDSGRVQGVGEASVWIAGDAAGLEQYTHVANHHAAVIGDHLAGSGERRYADVVVPACVFLDPPAIVVGPMWSELQDDADIVWAEIDLETPRSSTDEHHAGFLAVAARKSTGCIIAANGIGAHFDEIVHAIVVAIDGKVPVRRLAQTTQPFPTAGEILSQVFDSLVTQLD